MIFIGDIAVPREINPVVKYLPEVFRTQFVVANLEGAIAPNGSVDITENKLYSDENVIQFLNEMNVRAVSLANNHILDVDGALENSIAVLEKNNISNFGAGPNLNSARRGTFVCEERKEYVLVAFGWKVISCIYASNYSKGVNPLEYNNIEFVISNLIKQYPEKKIIAIMHWDYELERYPMPAHRLLARRMIDSGVEAVIGHHPHCIQGTEFYNGKLIAYSLGNWFIPGKTYMNHRLIFPQYTYDEMAIEISDDFYIHHFNYDIGSQSLNFINSSKIADSQILDELSPFRKMEDNEYVKWFRENRYKRNFLPIFTDYRLTLENRCKYSWVTGRQKVINVLSSAGLKKRKEGK